MTRISGFYYDNKLGPLNLIVLLLSIYVLGAMLADTFFKLPAEISKLLHYADYFICIVFFTEFCVRFYKAPNKLQFMKWGWIDLISSIPEIEVLRAGRLFRLIRLIRIVRAFRSTNQLIHHVFKNKIQGTIASAFVFTVLLIIFSSIAILQVENDPESNILTATDAVWWSYETITMITYGEKFPVTTEGRLIAAVLMTTGVALFGTFTGFIASWFVKDQESESTKP